MEQAGAEGPQGIDALADESFCYVTTTGRRTGNPHSIEIWFGLARRPVAVAVPDHTKRTSPEAANRPRAGGKTGKAAAPRGSEPASSEAGSLPAAKRTIYVLSGGREQSDWVRNIAREPEVTVRIGQQTFGGRAHIVSDAAEDRMARDLVFGKYAPRYTGDLTNWRDRALPIAIDLLLPPDFA
jgi:hypothetical protein